MSTHRLCFEQKYEKYQCVYLKIFSFWRRYFLYIWKVCFRNESTVEWIWLLNARNFNLHPNWWFINFSSPGTSSQTFLPFDHHRNQSNIYENVDGGRTDGRWMPVYTIISPVSLFYFLLEVRVVCTRWGDSSKYPQLVFSCRNRKRCPLTLKAPVTTIVVCFVICLWFQKSFLLTVWTQIRPLLAVWSGSTLFACMQK